MQIETTVKAWGIGWVIALVVLIVCVILWLLDRPLTGPQILCLIAALALARLL